MTQPTRLSLLHRLQVDRSEAAWEEFAAIYEQMIQHWLDREHIQKADADDVRQDVMTVLFAEIGNFQHNGQAGAFRCWLRRIVANRIRRLWDQKSKRDRKCKCQDLLSIADQLADDTSRLSVVWDKQHDAFVVKRLLERLRTQFREQTITAFFRVAINEEDAEFVADDMGITLGALRVAQHRVLRALKHIAGPLLDCPS